MVKRGSSVSAKLLVLALALSLPACAGTGASPKGAAMVTSAVQGVTDGQILLGIHTPLTGPIALSGTSEKDAFEVWAAQVNAGGGIHGRTIKIVAYDDQASPQQALNYVRRLLDQDKVFALVAGSASGSQLPVMDVIRESGIPFIVALPSNPNVIKPGDKNIFRIYPNDATIGSGVVDYVVSKLKSKRPAIIYNTNDYGLGGLEATEKQLKTYNLQFVAKESYNVGDTDFSAQLLRIKKSNPDVLITYSLHQEASTIVRQGKELGITAPFVGGGATANPLLPQAAGKAGVGFLTAYYVPKLPDDQSVPAIKQYVTDLKARYSGNLPAGRPSQYDFLGYGAAKLTEKALRDAGKDLSREKFVAALEQIKEFDADGVIFPVSFGPNRREGGTKVGFLEVTPEQQFKVIDQIGIKQ